LIILKISGEEYKLWSSTLCNFLQSYLSKCDQCGCVSFIRRCSNEFMNARIWEHCILDN
jgi:hypothetical protein